MTDHDALLGIACEEFYALANEMFYDDFVDGEWDFWQMFYLHVRGLGQ